MIGKCGRGAGQRQEGALHERLEPGEEDPAESQPDQCGEPAPETQAAEEGDRRRRRAQQEQIAESTAERQAAGSPLAALSYRVDAGAREDGHRQGQREDPAERRVRLLEQRQRVDEGVDGCAEHAAQREEGQEGEERDDAPSAWALREGRLGPGRYAGDDAGGAGPEPPDDGDGREEQGEQSEICAALDVVLDPPVDVPPVGLARCRGALPGEEVEDGVVSRIAKEVGDGEGDQSAGRIGPSPHLFQACGLLAAAEAGGGDLVQGDELDRAQGQTQQDHQPQPERGPDDRACPLVPAARPARWAAGQRPLAKSPRRVRRRHEQHEVGDLGVASEHLTPYAGRSEEGPGQRRRVGSQGGALLYEQLHHGQDEGQPRRPGDDHRVDGRDGHEAAELEGDSRNEAAEAPNPKDAGEQVGKHPGQPQLQPDKDAEGAPQRKDVEQEAQRIER